MSFKSILNVPFGKIEDGSVKVSFGIGGIALAAKDKDGNLRSYNPSTKSIDIVPSDLSFGDFPAYVFPVDSKALAVGDLILYNGKDLGYFAGPDEDGGNNIVIDIKTAELKTLVPTKSIFGFNFVAKVISPLAAIGGTAPAGGAPAIDPMTLVLMSALGDGDILGDGDSMLPLLLMTGGLGGAGGAGGAGPLGALGSNPLLMLFLMKGAL